MPASDYLTLTAKRGSGGGGGGALRGQFCVNGNYPYGPRPGIDSNVFFYGELDAVWRVDRPLAERAKADYRARGLSHIVCGPVYGLAYSHHYPDTDYRTAPEEYAEFLRWWNNPFTLSVFPTHAPYFDRNVWDLDAIRRDFLPFYQHPAIQQLVTRTMFCYEEYGRTAHMAECFDLCREMFPHARRYWHNPPGHLSPAMGDEGEELGWIVAAQHGIHGLYIQCHAVDEVPPPELGFTALQRALYDVWDMQRRFKGSCPVPPLLAGRGFNPRSPWDRVIKTVEGQDLELVYSEGMAHGMYWDKSIREEVCDQWGAAMVTVDGVVDTLDGVPRG